MGTTLGRFVTEGNSLQGDAQGFDKARPDRGAVNMSHSHSEGERYTKHNY